MNPAGLKVNVDQLKAGGLIIADEGEFTERNLAKAKYDANPLTDGSLDGADERDATGEDHGAAQEPA